MRSFHLRPFTPADAPAWVALTNAALGRNTSPERLLEEDARATGFNRRWVVSDGEKLLGVARLNAFAFIPDDYLQASIFVAPDAQGQGVGRRLWQTLRDALPDGINGLSADVADTDPPSLAWAERWGFNKHVHRFASELRLDSFDETPFAGVLGGLAARGITIADLRGADDAAQEKYVDLIRDLLPHTPDLAGQPRWSAEQVRETFHLNHDPHPEWQLVARDAGGQWLGLTHLVRYGDMAYNEFTAVIPAARGQGLALPLKLHAIRRARAAGLKVMQTNNHSQNVPMLAVNRRLGFVQQPGKFELRWVRGGPALSPA